MTGTEDEIDEQSDSSSEESSELNESEEQTPADIKPVTKSPVENEKVAKANEKLQKILSKKLSKKTSVKHPPTEVAKADQNLASKDQQQSQPNSPETALKRALTRKGTLKNTKLTKMVSIIDQSREQVN